MSVLCEKSVKDEFLKEVIKEIKKQYGEKPLGEFVREIVGLDMAAAKAAFAEYLNDEAVVKLIEKATFDDINDELIEKFIPMLNHDSKEAIFQKILDGKMDWHFIKALLPYADYITTQIEAAVVAGALPWEVLDILNDYYWDRNGYRRKEN